MTLSADLMGLGENPLMAARVANAGTGPLNVTVTASGAAPSAQVYGTQFVLAVTAGQGSLYLPNPSSATPPYSGDNFVIHNSTTNSVTVYPASGVTVNIGGVAYVTTNPFTLVALKTLTIWTAPTTSQWFGLSA